MSSRTGGILVYFEPKVPPEAIDKAVRFALIDGQLASQNVGRGAFGQTSVVAGSRLALVGAAWIVSAVRRLVFGAFPFPGLAVVNVLITIFLGYPSLLTAPSSEAGRLSVRTIRDVSIVVAIVRGSLDTLAVLYFAELRDDLERRAGIHVTSDVDTLPESPAVVLSPLFLVAGVAVLAINRNPTVAINALLFGAPALTLESYALSNVIAAQRADAARTEESGGNGAQAPGGRTSRSGHLGRGPAIRCPRSDAGGASRIAAQYPALVDVGLARFRSADQRRSQPTASTAFPDSVAQSSQCRR